MKPRFLFPLALAVSLPQLWAADLTPDKGNTFPENAQRPVVVTPTSSQISDFKSQIPKADLPEGMELQVVAAAPLVTHPMMACVDGHGRMFVCDAVGLNWNKKQLEANPPNRVLMLEDTNGDGIYDKSTVFADHMTFPQGACWLNGSLYVCSPPSLWKLTDTDGDGVADKREELVTGFDYTGNAADVHGPWLHPNGRLYWCHGRKGHKVVGKDGKVVHEGLASGIWSCKPDGTDVQWHSLGCGDNPVKVDFTPEGDVIGVQNLYYSQPRGDTLVHWLYGGVYERADQMKAIEGLPKTLEHMPVMYNFGHVAVSGCCFARSGVLFPNNPQQLLVTHFNTQRVVRMELTPDGATYRATPNEFLKIHDPDVHLTDVIEDPRDGSLLVINTGGWFRIGCPSSLMAKPDALGAIYRVQRSKDSRIDGGDKLAEQAKLLNEFWKSIAETPDEAKKKIERALGSKGGGWVAYLNAVDSNLTSPWILNRLNEQILWDTPENVRKVNRENTKAFDAGEPVQGFYSAEAMKDDALLGGGSSYLVAEVNALARLKDKSSTKPLAELLRWNLTPQLEHAVLWALTRIADTETLSKIYAASTNERQRPRLLGVLHYLDKNSIDGKSVIQMALSSNARASAAAANIIEQHKEWSDDFVAQATAVLGDAHRSKEVNDVIERLMVGFLSDANTQKLMASLLSDTAAENRSLAWRILSQAPSVVSNEAWLPPLQNSLTAAKAADLPLLLDAIKKLKAGGFDEKLQAIANDTRQPLSLRLRALSAMKSLKLTADTFVMLQHVLTAADSSAAARIQAATMLASAPLQKDQLATLAPVLASVGPLEMKPLLSLVNKCGKDVALARTVSMELAKNPTIGSQQESVYRTAFSSQPPDLFETILLPALHKATEASEAKMRQLGSLSEKVIKGGDAKAGRLVYESGKSVCIACHKIGDKGRAIGPDLSHIGAIRTERDLLESIIFPSNTLARDYEAHVIETSDGQNFMGVIKSHTAEGLLLVDAAGQEKSVPDTQIVANTTLTTSLMPMGLDQTITEKELCDLVAWLRSLK